MSKTTIATGDDDDRPEFVTNEQLWNKLLEVESQNRVLMGILGDLMRDGARIVPNKLHKELLGRIGMRLGTLARREGYANGAAGSPKQ